MLVAITMIAAAILAPVALIALVGVALKATDNAADDLADSDRAASFAEFRPVHESVDKL